MNALGVKKLEDRRVWRSLHGISYSQSESVGKVEAIIGKFFELRERIGIQRASSDSIDACFCALCR